MKCQLFPGPGDRHRVLVNPMREYIHSDETNLHHEFKSFKNFHAKKYSSEIEHKERMHVFRQNLRYIESMNRKGLTYRLAVNHLADKTDEELQVITGKLRTKPNTKNNGLPFDMSKYNTKLPDSFDWRIYGARFYY